MRLKCIKLASLEEEAKYRGPEYLAEMLAAPALLDGAWVRWPIHRYSALRERYQKVRPSVFQQTLGFFREITKWTRAGFRITHWRTFLARSKACRGCHYSVDKIVARCGRCGCTRAKLMLATARCPEKRWQG